MYFILSKILLLLLFPFLWIFVLLLIACITKKSRLRKRLLISSVVLLYLFSCPLLLNQFASAWDVTAVPTLSAKPYSCGIVLGGFTSIDKNGNGYFNGSADRFIQSVKLLATHKISHLLNSGGNGGLIPGKFREADWVKTQLKDFNFPDSSLLFENRSRNTLENAKFSKPILQQAHLQPPYLLITSAFHMRRAAMIFKKQGINIIPYPCNFMGGMGGISLDDLIPDAGTLGGWNMYLKEVVGYVVDYLKKS
jgi:uncharacterized SAM-binding protein YcdF (DUF218 family)